MENEDLIGEKVTVYDRNLFSIPATGIIDRVSCLDGAYSVVFDKDEGENITKHDGKFFLKEQCRVDGEEEKTCDCKCKAGQEEKEEKAENPIMDYCIKLANEETVSFTGRLTSENAEWGYYKSVQGIVYRIKQEHIVYLTWNPVKS